MTRLLSKGLGYGKAHANNSENFIIQSLPAGYMFWAFESTSLANHLVYLFVNEVQVAMQNGVATATGKFPIPAGSTVRIQIVAPGAGYYMVGWGHSELDMNSDHWGVSPATTTEVAAMNMNALARSGKDSVKYAQTGSLSTELEMAAFQSAANGVRGDTETYDEYYSSTEVGWMLKSDNFLSDTQRVSYHSVYQSGIVWRLPDLPSGGEEEITSGYDVTAPWGYLASGDQVQFGAGRVQFRQYNQASGMSVYDSQTNTSTVYTWPRIPTNYEFRAMEMGAFTHDVTYSGYYTPAPSATEQEKLQQDSMAIAPDNKWGPYRVGWQTGIGSPVFTLSNDPESHGQIISKPWLTASSFYALDLTEPGVSARYVGISGSIVPRHDRPDPALTTIYHEVFETAMEDTRVMLSEVQLILETIHPARIQYRGFPLFGVLKVKTAEGYAVVGLSRQGYDPAQPDVITVGLLRLEIGSGWVQEVPDAAWTNGALNQYQKALKIKVDGGWEPAALMREATL